MREEWSKIGFILASIGSAIGLGNIWRFSYIVGQSGGGAFLIPYFIAILFFGIPLMMVELATGRKFKGSIITSLEKINQKIKYLGAIPIIINIVILSYYLVITGWTFAYFIFSIIGYLPFEVFTKTLYPLFFFIGVMIVTAIIVSLGIKKGIEKLCNYLLPLLFIFIIILLFKALSLPNAIDGIKFYLTPDLNALSNPYIWILAFGQVFFSLSAGFGIMLTYGSYLNDKEKIPQSAFMIAGADTLIAVLAGFIIFPIVFSFGFNPAAGPELAFVTLPTIFSNMEFGNIFGMIFFLLLFIAAITSAVSMLEPSVTVLIDEFKLSRKKAVVLLSLLTIALGTPSALSYTDIGITIDGKPFLDMVDLLFGSLLTPLAAVILCISIGWFWQPEIMLGEINKNSKIKIPYGIVYLVRYVIPMVLIITFILKLMHQ